MGYSFGSLVTIELTRKIEAKGFNGRLILIDGAPLQIQALIKQQLNSSVEEELENNVLLSIMNTFSSINREQVRYYFSEGHFFFLFFASLVLISKLLYSLH